MKESYPLHWPDGWKHTPQEERRNLGSKLTLYRAARSLISELERLGATDVIISTNVPVRFTAHGDASFADRFSGDVGAAVYFRWKGKALAMACDSYFWVAQNVRGLALTIEAMRAIERHGASDMMERAFRGFTALPETTGEPWRNVFGFTVTESVDEERLDSEFRRLAHIHHPDKGGSAEAFQRLLNARNDARRALGLTA